MCANPKGSAGPPAEQGGVRGMTLGGRGRLLEEAGCEQGLRRHGARRGSEDRSHAAGGGVNGSTQVGRDRTVSEPVRAVVCENRALRKRENGRAGCSRLSWHRAQLLRVRRGRTWEGVFSGWWISSS